MNEIKEKFLPLGTICMLENGKRPIMIIGYLPATNDEPKKVFDYTGCIFPEGMITNNQTAVFNHKQIKEVLFMGYENDASKTFHQKLNDLVKENNIVPSETLPNISETSTSNNQIETL